MEHIFIFAFNTGCRLNEISQLKWVNINFKNKIIIIGDYKFTAKNKRQRIIPISDELLELLPRLYKNKKKSHIYVFSKADGFPYCGDYISKHFKDAVRKTNLNQDIHFHTLRHSFASNLANNGVPIIVIKELMGHKDISTTQIYSHTNLEVMQREIKKLNLNS